MKFACLASSLVVLVAAAGSGHAQPVAAQPPPPASPPPYGMPIDGDQAQQAIVAAEAEARQNHWLLSFAVVDAYGNLVMFKRMSGAPPFTGEVATKKAKTAAMFRMPSKTLAEAAARGGPPVSLIIPDAIPVEGGVPIFLDGKIIGAIGASGAQSSQDAQAAAKGAAAVR